MTVRSDQLGDVTPIAAAGAATLFTVPAGETWIVKRLVIFNQGALASKCYANLLGTGQVLWAPSVAALTADDHDTWWALEPGRVFNVAAGVGAIVVSAFGAKLIGTA